MSDVISLTPDSVDAVLPDVPKLARLAIRFASNLKRGTLDMTLPDGRVVRCGGLEPGPAAKMTVYNYNFAWRLAHGGADRPESPARAGYARERPATRQLRLRGRRQTLGPPSQL